ncbi:MAG TPA: hypothetical protein VGD99_28650, partial [Anaerolineae bacterium]
AFSSLVLLGEAPDEPAHLSYARFIARTGHLPTSLSEREAAGYRSVWPPLYHLLVAVPLAGVGDTPPARLKSVGDTPRRLIPTNGQTIAAFIHTADEAWPWRGLTLAWHLGRLISVSLTALAVVVTYLIAWRLTTRHGLALAAASLQATMPQVLFTGSVLNDDNLAILFSGLLLLTLVTYSRHTTPLTISKAFIPGALLGLATVTKYNTLPLWPLTLIWITWLAFRTVKPRSQIPDPRSQIPNLFAFLTAAALTAGWWFAFIWINFNRVETLGLVRGPVAAISAGTSDISLRHLMNGEGFIAFPSVRAWVAWFVLLFQSFWGLYGGGSTIELPAWVYWLLAMFCLAALGLGLSTLLRKPDRSGPIGPSPGVMSTRPTTNEPQVYPRPALILFLLAPLFFLPLPMLRFILSGGSIVETAQGRHFYPALPAITFALVWGLWQLPTWLNKIKLNLSKNPTHSPSTEKSLTRFQNPKSKIQNGLPLSLILLTLTISLYSLILIRASYPPPIPLWTTAEATRVENRLDLQLAEGVTLMGIELAAARDGVLPVTLVWQATAIPSEDYLIDLTLTNADGVDIGAWSGQPIGGRYPTRAWDRSDVLRDTIPIPLLPGLPPGKATLTGRLLDPAGQSMTPAQTLAAGITLPAMPEVERTPPQLRADGLAPAAPFTYRGTLSFILTGTRPPELTAPAGQVFSPARFLSGSNGSIAHFIVAANWPSGAYKLEPPSPNESFRIINRPRQFEPPPIAYILAANFADHLTLLGYDLPQRRVQPGESFPLTLTWRADRPIGEHLTVFNHLLDRDAVQRGGADRIPLKYYTTLLWVPGEIVVDAYPVPVKASAPPGIYWLDVGLYPSERPDFSLPRFVEGQPIDQNSVRLGPIKVGGPPPGVTATEARPQMPINKTFGEQIMLLGFDLVDGAGNSGAASQDLQLTAYWQAEVVPAGDYTVFVHLVDAQDNVVAQFDGPPAGGQYPTSLWEPGEIIVDERVISGLSPGRYMLQVGLYRPDTGERLPAAGVSDGTVSLMEFEVEE